MVLTEEYSFQWEWARRWGSRRAQRRIIKYIFKQSKRRGEGIGGKNQDQQTGASSSAFWAQRFRMGLFSGQLATSRTICVKVMALVSQGSTMSSSDGMRSAPSSQRSQMMAMNYYSSTIPSESLSFSLKALTRGRRSFSWFFSWKLRMCCRKIAYYILPRVAAIDSLLLPLLLGGGVSFLCLSRKSGSNFDMIQLASNLLQRYLTRSSHYSQAISPLIFRWRMSLTSAALLYGILLFTCIFRRSLIVDFSSVWTNLNSQSTQFLRILPKTAISLSREEYSWMPETMLLAASMVSDFSPYFWLRQVKRYWFMVSRANFPWKFFQSNFSLESQISSTVYLSCLRVRLLFEEQLLALVSLESLVILSRLPLMRQILRVDSPYLERSRMACGIWVCVLDWKVWMRGMFLARPSPLVYLNRASVNFLLWVSSWEISAMSQSFCFRMRLSSFCMMAFLLTMECCDWNSLLYRSSSSFSFWSISIRARDRVNSAWRSEIHETSLKRRSWLSRTDLRNLPTSLQMSWQRLMQRIFSISYMSNLVEYSMMLQRVQVAFYLFLFSLSRHQRLI